MARFSLKHAFIGVALLTTTATAYAFSDDISAGLDTLDEKAPRLVVGWMGALLAGGGIFMYLALGVGRRERMKLVFQKPLGTPAEREEKILRESEPS